MTTLSYIRRVNAAAPTWCAQFSVITCVKRARKPEFFSAGRQRTPTTGRLTMNTRAPGYAGDDHVVGCRLDGVLAHPGTVDRT
jgi:hypothetical protein